MAVEAPSTFTSYITACLKLCTIGNVLTSFLYESKEVMVKEERNPL